MLQKAFTYVAWPEVNENAIDKNLEKEMDLAYTIVKLGRSARNGANIKNRQPLSKMLSFYRFTSRILWRNNNR